MTMRLSLGPRLAAAFAVPSMFAVLACGAVAYLGTRGVLEDELGRRLCALAQVGAASVPVDLVTALDVGDDETRTAQNIRKRLFPVQEASGAARVLVVGKDRRVRVDSSGHLQIGAEAQQLALDAVEMERAATGVPTASVLFTGFDGRTYKSCYARVPGAEPPLFVVVEGAADLFSTLQQLLGLYLLLLVLALVLLVAAAGVVGRQVSRPLQALAGDARAMGEGRLDRVVSIPDQEEVGQVARALDEMRLRLRARDAERQMMLAGIAHEVRNPLGGMELYAGMLAEMAQDLPQETPQALRTELVAAVDRIRRELGYLGDVVNDFLQFARETPPQRRKVDVGQLLQEVVSLAQPEAQRRNVSLVARSTRVEGMLDEGQIKGALLNLVQNATQACQAGHHVEVGAREEGGNMLVWVEDDGPGMTPEQREKALTPFFTTKEKGSGLGLPLVVKTARLHGGRLELETSPGKGCRALLVLPASADEAALSQT